MAPALTSRSSLGRSGWLRGAALSATIWAGGSRLACSALAIMFCRPFWFARGYTTATSFNWRDCWGVLDLRGVAAAWPGKGSRRVCAAEELRGSCSRAVLLLGKLGAWPAERSLRVRSWLSAIFIPASCRGFLDWFLQMLLPHRRPLIMPSTSLGAAPSAIKRGKY